MRFSLSIASLFMCLAVRAADVGDPGFEHALASVSVWQGPTGGGLRGGQGGGEFVNKENSCFIRSGEKSACLKVWDHGSNSSVAWSSLSQTLSCAPLKRLRAEAWVLASSNTMPLASTGTMTQLRIEYFADEKGRTIIPTHAVMSEPFPLAASHGRERWHKLEISDRVPFDARSMKLSVVLMSEKPGNTPQAIWVDDVQVETTGARR